MVLLEIVFNDEPSVQGDDKAFRCVKFKRMLVLDELCHRQMYSLVTLSVRL